MRKAACILVVLAVAGCTSMNRENKLAAGAVIGATLGAAMGWSMFSGTGDVARSLWAVGFGALGGYAGHYIADRLVPADETEMHKAAYESLEVAPLGASTAWRNDQTGHAGSFTTTRAYTAKDGRTCRDFTANVTIDAETAALPQTACRRQDGAWVTV
ncbi:MAG: RT0821/Lpp0805 family surface protein [Alphaproteobacteria bacterium]